MTQTTFHYMVHTILFDGLEKFLNDLELHAEGLYEIVSIFEKQTVGSRSEIGVVIKFHISSELDFDEADIKRRLGF